MQDQTQKLKAIRRLLGQFPEQSGPTGETLEQRAERMALRTTGYLTAIDGFDLDLVDDGVELVLKGELPGHDGRWAPTPPMLATACRIAAERAARQRYLNQITAPRLPAPEIVKTPEQQERARQQVAKFIASQGPTLLEQRASDQATKDRLAKHDSFFADDFVPAPGVGRISKTLAEQFRKLGYSVGAPEADGEAA